MKKIYALFAAVLCGMAMNAKTLYLAPNDNWKEAGARFAIYAFGNGEGWTDMTAVSGASGIYQATVDDKYPYVIFCRMNPSATENTWGNKWNQTQDMQVQADKNLCTIASGAWDNGGSWGVYDDGGQGGQGGGGGQGGQGGGQGGGSVEGNPRYYYKMYTASDETWHEPSEETLFDHGVADVIAYTGNAYVFVLYQVDGQGGVQYRTEQFVDATHRQARLVLEGPSDWQLPAGVTNLYLYDNEDGSLTVSADPIPGKKLADPQPEGIENTQVSEKARKVIIDGQLRIVRGDKIFDATGRQL